VLSGLKYWLQNNILIQKFPCQIFNFNQTTYFYNLEAFNYHFLKDHKKYEKIDFVGILKATEDFGMDQHPHPDPLVRGTDPRIRIRIRIRTKMLQFRTLLSANHTSYKAQSIMRIKDL
jgi:hypothetical protein